MFEENESLPAMFTDEAKVSQILRNFVSNAIKFTERGEIRVKRFLYRKYAIRSPLLCRTLASVSRRRNRSACSSSIIRSIALDNER